MKVTENENKEIVKKIREGLEKTGGYCPCRIQRTPDNGVVPRFGRIGFYAGGEGEVHGDQAVHQILAPLFVQADEDFSGFFRLAVQQGRRASRGKAD